jgi:F-type H+-transporting ATPase subunit gamma
MAATLRELRGRIRSAGSIKKITKAQEMIATSRIGKAQARLKEARPYATEITRMLTTLAGAFRRAEELFSLLRESGKTPVLYTVGRKALGYYRFRNWDITESWTGFSERPSYQDAAKIAETLVKAFMAGAEVDGERPEQDGPAGVDELHIVYTEFKSMMSQSAGAHRIAPMVVEYVEDAGPYTLYSFEPDATTLFESLLPRYLTTRVYAALLESAASELASRQRAMKSASDNADDLIKALTLEANRERQAQITQEISEIVGGANALADAAK